MGHSPSQNHQTQRKQAEVDAQLVDVVTTDVVLFAAEQATQTALQAVQTLGGVGYINDSPTGRLLRDAKLYEIGAGTTEIRKMLIGRELFRASSPD